MIELTKVCTKCDTEKDVAEYNKSKFGKHGVTSECKICCNRRAARNYEVNKEFNKEALAVKQKAYRHANKKVIAERKKAYYEANKEAVAEKASVYLKTNRHIFNALTAKRKAAKLQATPAWVDLEAVKGMYQLATIFNRTGMNLHVDHIIPLQSDLVCGLHCESNMQLMPASDNISKGNRHWPDQWV